MVENNGPKIWGPAVDDAIASNLFGPEGEPTEPAFQGPGANDPVRSTVAALSVIERHLVPVRSEDLGALALLRVEASMAGADAELIQGIAQLWEQNHPLRGPVGPLLQAFESASAQRLFRGATGQISRQVGGAPGGSGRGGLFGR